jgi:hypothetical protein
VAGAEEEIAHARDRVAHALGRVRVEQQGAHLVAEGAEVAGLDEAVRPSSIWSWIRPTLVATTSRLCNRLVIRKNSASPAITTQRPSSPARRT